MRLLSRISFSAFALMAMVGGFGLVAGAVPAMAGFADVVGVVINRDADNTYRFDVTVAHADSGWDHYADAWQVIGPQGQVLAERVLTHPHEDEQPFTRSLAGVKIPDGITEVTLRAHDLKHGYGGQEMNILLPGRNR